MKDETKPKKRAKRNIVTFIPDEDVDALIEAAIASGATLKEIANAAIRKHGREILSERAKELRKKADELEKGISLSKR